MHNLKLLYLSFLSLSVAGCFLSHAPIFFLLVFCVKLIGVVVLLVGFALLSSFATSTISVSSPTLSG